MSEGTSSSNTPKTCGLCNENTSKYCCPRCEVYYCSLNCYKSEKHLECSEDFYRDCINEELASQQTDNRSRHDMIDILKRLQNEDLNDPNEFDDLVEDIESVGQELDSDDEEEMELHNRIEGLNLDDADALWSALTEDERNDFEALVSQGDVGSILPKWEPWWTYSKEEKLVQDVEIKDNDEEVALKKCPAFVIVPKITTLTTVQPSSSIRFNITNLLASYTFVTRYFNGELDPVEASSYLLNICTNLDNNTVFNNVISALESVVQRCLQSELIHTDELSLEVMKHDTFLILQGPSKENKTYYCKAALSHTHSILTDAKSAIKSNKNNTRNDNGEVFKESPKTNLSNSKGEFSIKFPEHNKEYLPQLDLSKIKKSIKKVEYYLSYIENCGMDFE